MDMDEKGLTVQFRKTPVYAKMVADILALAPHASQYEIDTCIWWYISKPDMYDCDEGKELLRAIDARNASNSFLHIDVDKNDDGTNRNIPETGQQPLRVCAGVHTPESRRSKSRADLECLEFRQFRDDELDDCTDVEHFFDAEQDQTETTPSVFKFEE
jgi:hypothetical protein